MDRLLIDLDADGHVSVAPWLDGESPGTGEPTAVAWPVDERSLEDLRWYLEDYLRVPFGVYEARGIRISDHLPSWGHTLFATLFAAAPARDAYLTVRLRGRPLELIIRSADPAWLSLPWELIRDPALPTPVALGGVEISRSLPGLEPASTFEVAAEQLRVLMVIARPSGARDVGYRMIARPLLDSLESVRSQVDVVVLRPPTLDRLRDVLHEAREAGEPFQIVHFDGHGAIVDGAGVLAFEWHRGGAEMVPADRVAEVLSEAQVPVAVLNACQSGAVGKHVEAAIATTLLAGGASAVVAMAYTVYAVAAAEFMTAFYARLFAGDSVGEAVRAGRERMRHRPNRPSPKGDLPLADWLIPVHYLRREVRFPHLRTQRADNHPAPDEHLEPVGEFVGRDDLFLTLEVATRTDRVVVLHGPAGTGKTELAKAFGRWWRDTGGVDQPEYVIWHSFAPGIAALGLAGVLDTIRRQIDDEQVLQALRDHRILVILDNFETVDDDAELRGFLAGIASNGRSAVLVTSRRPEEWLGDVRRIKVGGLARHEAIDYANHLLAPFPAAAARRADRAFGELLDWLDGNPMTMRLILPLLDTMDATTILSGLRGLTPLPDVSASLDYSFHHLSREDQRLLPIIGLFHSVVDADVLGRLGGPDTETWVTVLDRAVAVGLLTKLGQYWYAIHPALPGYLATQWRAEQRAAAERALLDAYAYLGQRMTVEIVRGNATSAFRLINVERRTFGHLLGYALDRGLWEQAQGIVQALDEYWNRGGLYEEARSWIERGRRALEGPDGTPPLADPAAALWIFLVSAQAVKALRSGMLDEAESSYQQIHDMLLAQPESEHRSSGLAVVFHQLGTVAELRSDWKQAEQWHRRSLAAKEELGDRDGQADSYNHLGIVAHQQSNREDAARYYRRAYKIYRESGSHRRLKSIYNQLAQITTDLQDWQEAESWSYQSITLAKELGDREGLALAYYQHGILTFSQQRMDEAEEWHRQALSIFEELGDRPNLIYSYFQLGWVALARRRLNDAEEWFFQAIPIALDLHHAPGEAMISGGLARLAALRGQFDEALKYSAMAIYLFEEFPHPNTMEAARILEVLTQAAGIQAIEEGWLRLMGVPLPDAVKEHLSAPHE